MELNYIPWKDVLVPDLELDELETRPLNKWGRMRKKYLMEDRYLKFSKMVMEGTLAQHLLEVEQEVEARMDLLLPQLEVAAGISEELKATDMMKWVGLKNACKAQAEEIIQAELIFV